MNIIIAIISLILLVILAVRQLSIWKLRALLSPGFYFAVIWSFGVLGIIILKQLDLLLEVYPQYIDELNILVSFTAICFLVLTKKGRNSVPDNRISFSFLKNFKVFAFMSVFVLILSFYDFYINGLSFDMGNTRANLDLVKKSLMSGYANSLLTILSIISGYCFSVLFNKKKRFTITFKNIFLLLPFISATFFSITIGGRVDIVYSTIFHLIGFSLGNTLVFQKRFSKKLILLLLIGFIGVNIIITAVSVQRAEKYSGGNENYNKIRNKNFMLGVIYGPMEYMVSSYNGYQYRRVDAVNKDEYGLGKYTFNGFINWTLPFSSQIGLEDLSIAKLFDVYYYNQETYDYERVLFYTTHSSYLTMIKDFGFYGTFICIMFLTWISHKLFVSIQKKQTIKYATELFWYFVFFQYWTKSNFYGSLSSSLLIPLYGFLIIDLINLFVKKNNKI